ncbi:MAG: hypothetical protein ACK5CA_00670 [Cyanobacteriota bacterium]|jgi:hypothetical protein
MNFKSLPWLLAALLVPLSAVAQPSGFNTLDQRSFFETGRLRSEDRLIFQRPPSGVSAFRAQSDAWQLLIFENIGVSLWMPPGILREETVTVPTVLGALNFRALASQQEDRRYLAAYASGLTPEQQGDFKALLQGIEAKAAPVGEFKLQSQRSVSLGEYAGEELRFLGKEEGIVFRVYLVKDKLYALGVRYPRSAPNAQATNGFLSSLQLL